MMHVKIIPMLNNPCVKIHIASTVSFVYTVVYKKMENTLSTL